MSTPSNDDPDTAALSALGQIARGLLTSQIGGDLSYGTLKRGFRQAMRRDPLDSLAAVVLGGSYLFYLAEKGQNPKVLSFWDALTFITTSLSVGYDDVFAKTDSGDAADTFATGGKLVYLTLGAILPISEKFVPYANVQLPIYQNVNGIQLTPKYTVSVGARYSF